MYHKFTEQNYPDLNVVVRGLPQKYCIQGYICHVIFAPHYFALLHLQKILTCLYIAQTKQLQTQLFKNYFEFA